MLDFYQKFERRLQVSVDLQRLAEFVRTVRKQKNLNQEDIRARGGPSTGWLGALEAGSLPSEPKPATLEKLAKGLGVSNEEIYFAAGHSLTTNPRVRALPFNNLYDRLAFLDLARKEKYPPTEEEEKLIRAFPDTLKGTHYVPLVVFEEPPDKARRDMFIPDAQAVEEGKRAEELKRLIEITNSLPPEEQEEVLEYARMRLRRLQEKRKE